MICFVYLLLFSAAISSVQNDLIIHGRSETMKALKSILRSHKKDLSSHIAEKNFDAKLAFAEALANQEKGDENGGSLPPEMMDRRRRSIANAVIESAHCEHIDLIDCSEYDTQDMSCMLTATGMTCCVCTGRLNHGKGWRLFRENELTGGRYEVIL